LYKAITKKIILFNKDNKIFNNKFIITCIQYIPFFFYVLKFLNFNILYEIDNLYFYDDSKFSLINYLSNKGNELPKINILLFSFKLVDDDNNKNNIDIIDNIRKYHYNVPLNIILHQENIEWFNKIEINGLNTGKIIKKKCDINDVKYNKLYDIYN
jgi:hypothetical protein